MNDVLSRPVTSTPRGVCKFYNSPRGCFAGNKCKFLHGDQATHTPYDVNKVCRFFAAGYCKHGEHCWFIHTVAAPHSTSINVPPDNDDDEDNTCAICFEKPSLYGLLTGCSHVFCLSCLKAWRDSQQSGTEVAGSGVHKLCPMCRTSSRFIIPSSMFYPVGSPMKALVEERYKESMKRVKCRYFEASPPFRRFCPFGKDCFYKHVDENGEPHVFDEGAEYFMRLARSSRMRRWMRPFELARHSPLGGDDTNTVSQQENTPSSPDHPPHPMYSLFEGFLEQLSHLPESDERHRITGVAAQLSRLFNRMIDSAVAEDFDNAERNQEQEVSYGRAERTPQHDSVERSSVQGPAAYVESRQEVEDISRSPYNGYVVGSPRTRGEEMASDEAGKSYEQIITVRQDWEDESEDEMPSSFPPGATENIPARDFPISPACSNHAKGISGQRRASSISSQLAFASPPLLAISAEDEIEAQERSDIIQNSILVAPPSNAATPSHTPQSSISFVADEEYQDEDEDMVNLVRSVHKTLFGQRGE